MLKDVCNIGDIQTITFSVPTALTAEKFGKEFIRIKVRSQKTLQDDKKFFVESFTKTQSFHKSFSVSELENFFDENIGKTFLNATVFTAEKEFYFSHKNGKLFHKTKVQTPLSLLQQNGQTQNSKFFYGNNRPKNYILQEGVSVPFLVELGVMTNSGKIVASKYDKFRQINRFLEFINDILPNVQKDATAQNRAVRIIDFGSGKSYLTFAVHYFLTVIKNISVEITGLDLKKDVITHCQNLAQKLCCDGLHFEVGDIANYKIADDVAPDLMICLHACDTATDLALDFAVRHKCKAILAVPCCQHEINSQISENLSHDKTKTTDSKKLPKEIMPILKHGILKERFAALATDAIRADALEQAGYDVQLLEFIDMAHTPKNILIRAVRTGTTAQNNGNSADATQKSVLADFLQVKPKILDLL